MAIIGNLTAVISADLTSFNQAMKSAQTTMRHTSMVMQRVGRDMSMYITTPMVMLGKAAFDAFKKFEFSMNKIVSLVGVSRKVVNSWNGAIKDLSKQTGRSIQELGDAMYFITSAGLRGKEAIDVLQSSAKAAAAGLGATKTVADVVTSAVNAYGEATLSAAKATDILIGTVREGKAEANKLVLAIGQVLPIASKLKVGFDQVGAAIASMTRTGTLPETAAMQLKNLLKIFLNPRRATKSIFDEMGVSIEKMQKQLASGDLLHVLIKLDQMAKKFGPSKFAEIFPNVRPLIGALDLIGNNVEKNIVIFRKLAHEADTTENAMNEASKTVQVQWEKATAHIQIALTDFGKSVSRVLIPAVQQLASTLEKLTYWWDSLGEGMQQFIITLGGIVAAVGPILLILGTLSIAISALANPIGIVISALSLLTVGTIAYKVSTEDAAKASETFEDRLKRLHLTQADMNKQISAETSKIKSLFTFLKSANKGTALRSSLIKKINTTYGQYLPNLLSEKSSLEEINTAEKVLIATTSRRIAQKFMEVKVAKLLQEQITQEREAFQRLRDEASSEVRTNPAVIDNSVLNAALMDLKKNYAKIAALDDQYQQELSSAWDSSLSKEEQNYGKMTLIKDKYTKKLQEIAPDVGSLLSATGLSINKIITAFTDVISSAYKTDDEIKSLTDDAKKFAVSMQKVWEGAFGGKVDLSSGKEREYLAKLRQQLEQVRELRVEVQALQEARKIDPEVTVGDELYLTTLKKLRDSSIETEDALKDQISNTDKLTAMKRALSIAMSNNIEVGSKEYQQILDLITAQLVEERAIKDSTAELDKKATALSKLNKKYIELNNMMATGFSRVEDKLLGDQKDQWGFDLSGDEKNVRKFWKKWEDDTNKMFDAGLMDWDEYVDKITYIWEQGDTDFQKVNDDKLNQEKTNLYQHLQLQDEGINSFYDGLRDTALRLKEAGKLSQDEYEKIIKKSMELQQKELDGVNESLSKNEKAWNRLGKAVAQSMAQAASSMLVELGRMLAATDSTWNDMVAIILGSALQIAQILFGMSMSHIIEHGAEEGGWVGAAIAGAVGTVVLSALYSSYVKSNMQGMAEGGVVEKTGSFMVGEVGEEEAVLPSGKKIALGKDGPAIANLPKGTTVIPNSILKASKRATATLSSYAASMLKMPSFNVGMRSPQKLDGSALGNMSLALQPVNTGGHEQLIARVSGQDLEFVLQRWMENKERL